MYSNSNNFDIGDDTQKLFNLLKKINFYNEQNKNIKDYDLDNNNFKFDYYPSINKMFSENKEYYNNQANNYFIINSGYYYKPYKIPENYLPEFAFDKERKEKYLNKKKERENESNEKLNNKIIKELKNIEIKNENNSNNKENNKKKDKIDIKRPTPLKGTKILNHGKAYKETTSPENFMKYNFDFVATEQYNTEHLIVDKDKQHVDFEKLKDLPQKEIFILKKDLVNLFKFIYKKWPKDLIEFNYKITFNIIQQFNFEKEAIQLFINNKEKFELYLKKIIELNKSNLI